MTSFKSNLTIPDLLDLRTNNREQSPICYFQDKEIRVGELSEKVRRLTAGLARFGIQPGDRVAVMLPNHPDYVITMLALISLRAIWVPINVRLRGSSLSYILTHCEPKAVIVDEQYRQDIEPIIEGFQTLTIWRETTTTAKSTFSDLMDGAKAELPAVQPHPDDVICISYTSGTTGEPKGVIVTDRMLQAAATGAILGGEIRDGDTLLLWEPIYHIAGSEVVIVALLRDVTIALLSKFSVSSFWTEVAQYQATHIHYVGGILQLLLKQPSRTDDAANSVRIAWGGGCVPEIWREFEQRFGVQIREVYGLTEASSISTMNLQGRIGSIGKSAPYFDISLVDEEGTPVTPGALGEIVIRPTEPGLLMSGYFRNSTATNAALRDGALNTGDLGRMDEDGYLYYAGRSKDSVRHRGENISAWEVEKVINEHPDVELSALVGVPADVGEDDLKIFVKPVSSRRVDPAKLIAWCIPRMPEFQVPRYVAIIDGFEVTPTHRIRKEILSRSTEGVWDRKSTTSINRS